MEPLDPKLIGLLVALGVGVLIGVDRERRKGEGRERSPAGIRTFAITALFGAACHLVGGNLLVAVATAGMLGLVGLAYAMADSEDPGLTTEIALALTLVLGALSMQEPVTAGFVAVVATLVLAGRTPIHRFVRNVLTEDELRSGLALAAAALVVLPLLPDQPIGPFNALNIHKIWTFVVAMMAISAAGYIAVRALGATHGLPLAGFVSGFVSSAATIAAMGSRSTESPAQLQPATSGAVLSTLATIIQMTIVLALTSPATLKHMSIPLLCAGAVAAAYAALFSLDIWFRETEAEPTPPGAVFKFEAAVFLAGLLAAVMFFSAALQSWLGTPGIMLASALAGFVDTHAPAASAASFASAGKLSLDEAVVSILAAMTTNSATKAVLAYTSGGPAFACRVIPGLILVQSMAWLMSTWLLGWR